MKYETTKSFYRTQVQSIAPYEDCYSLLVSGLTKDNVGKLHCIVGWTMGWDSETEVWPRFQSWNVAEILKLNFDQRKIWPKISFFAASTQALGPLCLGNLLTLWPEIMHAPVVQLAALVNHPSPTRLLVLHNHIHSLVSRFLDLDRKSTGCPKKRCFRRPLLPTFQSLEYQPREGTFPPLIP